MSILVRRSNLLVAITDEGSVADCWRSNADAITLDLDRPPGVRESAASLRLQHAISWAGHGAAEVFVRVNKMSLRADLDASIWPGLAGVVLPHVVSAQEVREAAEIVAGLERRRGLAEGSLSLILVLDSARAVWDIHPILLASRRTSQAGLDERALASSLGLEIATPGAETRSEVDPFTYARGRLVVEAIAANIAPIGFAFPLSVSLHDASPADVYRQATVAKNLGMKGVLCPHAGWVAPVNDAFTPNADLVAYSDRVRATFAAGIAAGTAAVPLDGRMIDIPVNEWATAVLAMADACAARDAEKLAAITQNP